MWDDKNKFHQRKHVLSWWQKGQENIAREKAIFTDVLCYYKYLYFCFPVMLMSISTNHIIRSSAGVSEHVLDMVSNWYNFSGSEYFLSGSTLEKCTFLIESNSRSVADQIWRIFLVMQVKSPVQQS